MSQDHFDRLIGRGSKTTVRPFWIFATALILLNGAAVAQLQAGENLKIPRLTAAPKIDGVIDALYESQALKIENFVQFMLAV